MTPSLRLFMEGLIDYAGLFPPARLPLEPAINNYARYRKSTEAWMLNRFICPASRLHELEPYHPLFEQDPPFQFSVLGSHASGMIEFQSLFAQDIEAVKAFRKRHNKTVAADVFEVRLPDELYAHPVKLPSFIHRLVGQTEALKSIYFESGLETNWADRVTHTVSALALYNKHRSGTDPEAAFKLRCGGLTASAFPSTEQVAFVLASCRTVGIPFKATAGLHHPVRHYDESVSTYRHGFINVFGAGILDYNLKLDTSELLKILQETDLEAFSFTESGFSWKARHLHLDQIGKARTTFAHSYGSCSFDEPRQDLKQAGLLLTFGPI